MQIKRKCATCKRLKNILDFNKRKTSLDGIALTCKRCLKKNLKWARDNPEKVYKIKNKWLSKNRGYREIVSLRSHLRRKYGLSIEEFENMSRLQMNTCKICGKKGSKKRRLSVDHSHKNGKIRGLLCRNCNSMLGLAKENPKTLISAIKYLKLHHKK